MDLTGRTKEEIPGSKCNMYGCIYTDLIQALKGEHLSSVLSPDGTLISASAAPHYGAEPQNILLPNLVWLCIIIISQNVMQKNWFTVFNVKVTAKVQNVSNICLNDIFSVCLIVSAQYLLNRSTIFFFNQFWYGGVLS